MRRYVWSGFGQLATYYATDGNRVEGIKAQKAGGGLSLSQKYFVLNFIDDDVRPWNGLWPVPFRTPSCSVALLSCVLSIAR
eukprot:scaffold174594_cov30-Prasinocladus_malaysianus.AAC.1